MPDPTREYERFEADLSRVRRIMDRPTREELVALLRRLEWNGRRDEWSDAGSACPCCDGKRWPYDPGHPQEMHAPDCALARAITPEADHET